MKISSTSLLLALVVLCVGCKAGGASNSTDNAGTTTAGGATASKTPDSTTPTDADSAPSTTAGTTKSSTSDTPKLPSKTGGLSATKAPEKDSSDSKPTASKSDAGGAGSSSKHSIVGDWTNPSLLGGGFKFTSDGKMIVTGSDPRGDSMDMQGTYKLDGNKLTVHAISMVITPSPSADAKTKSQIEQVNAQTAASMKSQKDQVQTIEWKDDNTISLTGGKQGQQAILKRKS
jgi:hypothetical protein